MNDLHDLGLSVRGRTVPIIKESKDHLNSSTTSTPAIAPKASAEIVIPSVSNDSRVYVPPPSVTPGVVKGLTPIPVPLPADDFINRNEVPEQLAIPTTTINNGVVSGTKPSLPTYTKAPLNADPALLTNVFGWPKQNESTINSEPVLESQVVEPEDNDTYEDDYEDYSGSHSDSEISDIAS